MIRQVTFEVLGVPQSKGSMKGFVRWRKNPETGRRVPAGVKVTSSNPRLGPWEDDIRAAIQLYAPGVFFEGPVALRIEFHMPRPKSAPRRVVLPQTTPDIDKLSRGACDALTGKLWRDDSQVVQLIATKVFAVDQPKAVYVISDAIDRDTLLRAASDTPRLFP